MLVILAATSMLQWIFNVDVLHFHRHDPKRWQDTPTQRDQITHRRLPPFSYQRFFFWFRRPKKHPSPHFRHLNIAQLDKQTNASVAACLEYTISSIITTYLYSFVFPTRNITYTQTRSKNFKKAKSQIRQHTKVTTILRQN